MFDVAWSELLVIGVVAIVVVGPKDLPKVLRATGQMMRKARGLADEFKAGIHDLIEEAELEETKKSIHHVSNFDPRNRPDAFIDPTTGAYVPPAPDGDDGTETPAPAVEAEKPAVEKSAAEKPAVEKPAAEAPGADKTGDSNGKTGGE